MNIEARTTRVSFGAFRNKLYNYSLINVTLPFSKYKNSNNHCLANNCVQDGAEYFNRNYFLMNNVIAVPLLFKLWCFATIVSGNKWV